MSGTSFGNRRVSTSIVAAFIVVTTLLFLWASPARAVSLTPDDTWMTNGQVYSTQLSEDGKILYVGGRFTVAKDRLGTKVARRNLAAFDVATGKVISTWKPQATGGDKDLVRELAIKNGKVYFGGTFTTVNGASRDNLAAVDAVTGNLVTGFAPRITTTNTDTTPLVYALLASDSKLYIGGEFNMVNGVNRAKIAAVNLTTGALDNAWKPRVNLQTRDLQFAGDGASIFAVGRFTIVTGSDGTSASRKNVARFYTDTGNVHPWAIPEGVIGETDQTSHTVLVTPTRIYAGFGDRGPNYVAAFRLDNGNTGDQIWRYGLVGDPQTLAMSPDGKRLLFGGHFGLYVLDQQVCGGTYLRGLASLNPNTGQLFCDWIPQLEPHGNNGLGPWAMTITDDTHLWVGGGFTGINGVPQSNLARFDLTAKSANYAIPKVDLNGFQKNSGQQRGGLNATYFDNMDFTGPQVTRVDSTINFDFGNGSPDPSIDVDTYSARWSGQVEAPVSGEYTFTTTSDDGVRLFVDGKAVLENYTDHAPTDDSGTITLEAGKRYDIQLDFYENGGGAMARLSWAYPGQARQIVPASALYFSGGTGYAADFVAGGGPVSIVDSANLAVTDADDVNLRSATVTLAARPDGAAESLSATTTGTAITAGYNSATGTLSLTGPASKAAFQQVLRTVRYNNTAASPTAGDRTVDFVVNDGFDGSNVATSTVSVR